MSQTLTTQQAADLLGISRLTLIKALDEGKLPYTRAGSHRRLALTDVLDYREGIADVAVPYSAEQRRRTPARPCSRIAASLRLVWRSEERRARPDRKSTRLNSSHVAISYAVFCLVKKR